LERERRYFAHSTDRPDRADWQPLHDHLHRVAALAHKHAAKFGAGEWGYAAGLLHDLGKYSDEFQARLEGRSGRVDHSTAGAIEAGKRFQALAPPLQFVVAGHHAGLANGGEEEQSRRSSLRDRLVAAVPDYSAYAGHVELPTDLPSPRLARHTGTGGCSNRAGFQAAFFTRMVFSCLVDADYLDTEAFYDRVEGRPMRRAAPPALVYLKTKLDAYLADLVAQAADTLVNRERAAILAACREKAQEKPGLFTLTVPTGGGKTLASLAFALEHALAHGLERVIYVIPYTSIIEQNAAVFREALGAEAVLEHHSAFIEDPKTALEARDKLRLAMEDWDATVVVTTAVQFFESLFADRPSRCRKLHNTAKSVVILDEAQMLPLPLLRPCVAALDELARNYRTSVVLCTATQPALIETDAEETSFKGGFRDVREIAPEPRRLYRTFKRVTVERLGAENVLTAEGRILHERSDKPGQASRGERRIVQSMPVRSRALGVAGIADVVELTRAGNGWLPYPIEYKRGRPKAHRADEVQLCAQALCLEEMFSAVVPEGALFYGKVRRRMRVAFDEKLRALTYAAAAETRAMLAAGRTPVPIYEAKRCDSCSLKEHCQPKRLACPGPVAAWLRRRIEETGSAAEPPTETTA
jgi:CRISPR-associated endonuclease/helicase Cas3